jgi:exopolyphosphatase/guanosine-5'-triphosphate,3'-diphosphate pyrophosphatase
LKLAAIDIGTNSIHMVVVRVDRAGAPEVVDRSKEMVRLGRGTLSSGVLPEDVMEEGLACLHRMHKLCKAHGCHYVVAAATSAVREASNRDDFLQRVFEETGMRVRVLSGEEEAELIFRAVQDGTDLTEKKALVFDLGGGSTEIVVGNAFGLHLAASLPIGIIRMTEEFAQNPGVTSRKRYAALADRVRELAGPTIEQARAVGYDVTIGTSGTFKCLGEMLDTGQDKAGRGEVHLPRVRRKDLGKLTAHLQSLTEAERGALKGMNPKRSPNIAVGATIILTLITELDVVEARLSNRALRDGLVLEAIRAIPDLSDAPQRGKDLRRRSVLNIARRHGGDIEHGAHVARLALELFDQTGGLHKLGGSEREKLEYAGYLHDLGLQAGYTKHHKHTLYLLTNAELAGFDTDEVVELAVISRYHRKSLPSTDHREFAALTKPRRKVISALAALLRIADALDRTHQQRVRRVDVHHMKDRVVMEVEAREDVELEIHAANVKKDLFEKLWERPVEFHVRSPSDETPTLLELTQVG